MSSSAKNSAISLNGVAVVVASLLVGISASAVQTPAVSERIASLGKAPLYFEATRSSDNESFVARGQDCDVVLESTVAVLSIGEHSAASSFPSKTAMENQPAAIRTVRLVLEGANMSATMSGLESLPGKVNYLLGSDSAQWRTGVPLFARVKVAEVYPGIDLVYYADQSARLEYDFVLQSSASPDQISFRIEGADKVSVDARGDLVLKIGSQEIRQHRPVIYQNVNGRRQPVEGSYALTGRNSVGFCVGDYDRSLPLVIDPVVDFSTFLGGSKTENGWAIAADAAGNIYVAGETLSKNLPTTPGAYTNHYAGGIRLFGDAFVAKYGAVSNELIYLTYLGGKTDDGALGLAVDAVGSAYVTGFTDSKNFPIVPDSGVIRSNLTGRNNNAFKLFAVDAFVTQLSPDGASLVFSTLLGGDLRDAGVSIAVEGSDVYVTGMTESTNFVPQPNGYQTNFGGREDVFVVKLTGGTSYAYSTFLGGVSQDHPESIAVRAGEAYLTGFTYSSNFPVVRALELSNAASTNLIVMDQLNAQTKRTSRSDAFVTRLNATGTDLIYSTFLGSTNDDSGLAIAVDASGYAYVTGYTYSKVFPTNAVPLPVANEKDFNSHVFVTKIGPLASNDVPYSVQFGSTRTDQGTGIAVDENTGYAYVAGFTTSTNFFVPAIVTDLRATNVVVKGSKSSEDVFVAVLNADASAFVGSDSVFLGGKKNDRANGIALQSNGSNVVAYIVGQTGSLDLTVTNAPQPVLGNGTKGKGVDAFVSRIVWP